MRGGAPDRRSGFTMVEVLVVLVVLSILARIAIPHFHEALLRARAAHALGDINVVETAAEQYYADTNEWPPDTSPGEVPPELVSYLPDNFSFTYDGYLLDWDNWSLPEGLPQHPGTGILVGVSITTDEPELGNALAQLLGPNGWYTLGNSYTKLIQRS